jgi:hypothetical protein
VLLVFLAGCSGGQRPGDAGPEAAPDIVVPDVQDTGPDVPPHFDAGPAPACAVTAMARHVIDRPGGDRVAEPSALVPVAGGFLAGLRRFDFAPMDGGVLDGGRVPTTRDSTEILPLDPDGTPRSAPITFYDGAPVGTVTDAPLLFPAPSGAYVIFQESRGNASDPDFVLRLRGGTVDAMGRGAAPGVLRERYTRPTMTALADGNLLGVSSRFGAVTDGGIVVATPMSLLLGPDGRNVRSQDVNINTFVPLDATVPVMRPTATGAVMVMRTGGHVGILRFDATGTLDAHGLSEVRGATIPSLDDAAAAGDGVVAVWSRTQPGGRTEVHVVVSSQQGELRLDRELESFTGEGQTVASAVPAYGGVAVLWKRGVDAAARVRVAVVQPDGVVRLAPRDLVAAPNIEGRVVAVASGRRVDFLVRDGIGARAWGYTFGSACIGE